MTLNLFQKINKGHYFNYFLPLSELQSMLLTVFTDQKSVSLLAHRFTVIP